MQHITHQWNIGRKEERDRVLELLILVVLGRFLSEHVRNPPPIMDKHGPAWYTSAWILLCTYKANTLTTRS